MLIGEFSLVRLDFLPDSNIFRKGRVSFTPRFDSSDFAKFVTIHFENKIIEVKIIISINLVRFEDRMKIDIFKEDKNS